MEGEFQNVTSTEMKVRLPTRTRRIPVALRDCVGLGENLIVKAESATSPDSI